tara:strand:+ start:109 stop:462 length:354 start_codon:yes stop_codon:yes gene_type:complete
MSSDLTIKHAGTTQTRTETGPAAKGVDLGANGMAYVADDAKYTPPDGMVVVAIQFVTGTVFDSTDTTADSNWTTRAQAGPGTGGDVFGSAEFPSGMTIYGRWLTVGLDSGSAIYYLG